MMSNPSYLVRVYDQDVRGVLKIVRVMAAKDEATCRFIAMIAAAAHAGAIACAVYRVGSDRPVTDLATFGRVPSERIAEL